MAELSAQAQSQLNNVTERFRTALPHKRHQLEQAWSAGVAASWGRPELRQLYDCAHRLAGSAAFYRMQFIGDQAAILAQQTKTLLELADDSYDANQQLTDNFDQLVLAIQDQVTQLSPDAQYSPELPAEALVGASRPVLALVDDDTTFAQGLAAQLDELGFAVNVYSDPNEALTQIPLLQPDAVVIDIMFAGLGDAGFTLARQLQKAISTPLPMLFLSLCDDLESRIQAARAGGKGYVAKPVAIDSLASQLEELLIAQQQPLRVLVLDEQHQADQNLQRFTEAGLEVEQLYSLSSLAAHLERFRPEVMLISNYWPRYGLVDLLRLVRQHDLYFDLPLLALQSGEEAGSPSPQQPLVAGADACLPMNTSPAILIELLRHHASRYRRRQARQMLDAVSGVLNRAPLLKRLEQECVRADRERQPLALGMVDITGLGDINKDYGSRAGDEVLRQLGQTLQQRLRRSDVVGRFGGDEFVLLLSNTNLRSAQRVLIDLRQQLQESAVWADEGMFNFQVRIGAVAVRLTHEQDNPDITRWLLRKADEALYVAKTKESDGLHIVDLGRMG